MTNIPLHVDDDIDEVRRLASRLTPICDELRALRAVADAASSFLTDGSCHRELEDALKAAGR